MKVIFLDVDGVLNSEIWFIRNHQHPVPGAAKIDLKYVRNLQKIVRRTGAEIVLSSTWRGEVRKNKKHPLHQILANHGMRIYDYTTTARVEGGFEKPGYQRGYEIQAWLDDHPDVTNIVILDDDNDMMHLEKYLVKTRFNAYDGHKTSRWWLEGLNRKKARAAIKMLNQPYVNIYKTKEFISRKKF